MKTIIVLCVTLLFNACGKKTSNSDTEITKNISLLIQPKQTDVNYSASENSHYVVRNTKTYVNKLLLFIGGSYSIPQNYNTICDHAASIGLDVISLSYPNDVATAPLGTSSDPSIFTNYREELCFGNPISSVVSVDTLNCITTRTIKLLLFLKANHSDQNWEQYLTSSNTLQWNKIIVAGHSQGSGHACYLGKKYLVDRVVMLSGPNDYSTYFSSPANWLTQNGQTPFNKQYSLFHIQDEIVPYSYQVENIKGLGLLTSTQIPTLVDNLMPPYLNAQSLSLNIPALSYHSATVGKNSVLPNIWTYLFTGN
jgi:hypothetical protein